MRQVLLLGLLLCGAAGCHAIARYRLPRSAEDGSLDARADFAVRDSAVLVEAGPLPDQSPTPAQPKAYLSLRAWNTTTIDLADIDGDGQLDLALGYIHVAYLARTTGRQNDICFDIAESGFEKCRPIEEQTLVGSASQTSHIHIGDFNRDQIPDIVSFNRFLGLIHLGQRVLNESIVFSSGRVFYQDLCKGAHGRVGDLNDDGRLDLVFYELWLGSQSNPCSTTGGSPKTSAPIVLGQSAEQPSPQFETPQAYLLNNPQQSLDLQLADVDSDGQVDIVVIGSPTQGVQWLRNNGTDFSPAATLPITVQTWLHDAKVADVDGDGHVDVVLVYLGNNTQAVVHFGAGDATFPASLAIDAQDQQGGSLYTVQLGDLNADGRSDLILARRYDDSEHDPRYFERLWVRFATQPRTFGPALLLLETEGNTSNNFTGATIRVARVDDNDQPDLVVGLSNRVDRILLNPNMVR